MQYLLWSLLTTDFLSDGSSNVCSISIYETFTNQIKCQNFELENKCQGQGGEKRDLRHSTRNVRFHIGDFFKEF